MLKEETNKGMFRKIKLTEPGEEQRPKRKEVLKWEENAEREVSLLCSDEERR